MSAACSYDIKVKQNVDSAIAAVRGMTLAQAKAYIAKQGGDLYTFMLTIDQGLLTSGFSGETVSVSGFDKPHEESLNHILQNTTSCGNYIQYWWGNYPCEWCLKRSFVQCIELSTWQCVPVQLLQDGQQSSNSSACGCGSAPGQGCNSNCKKQTGWGYQNVETKHSVIIGSGYYYCEPDPINPPPPSTCSCIKG